MGHAKELLDLVQDKLKRDYADSEYTYVRERSLPGTRMQPDILVYSKLFPGKPVCVVEIGYTRPEKLTAYRRKHRIKDVRWYDKKGKLHGDVEERVVRATVKLRPEFVYLYRNIPERICCPLCFDSIYRITGSEWQNNEDLVEQSLIEASCDTCCYVLTDYCLAFVVLYCDVCDTLSVCEDLGPEADLVLLSIQESTPRELGRFWGGREKVSYDQGLHILSHMFEGINFQEYMDWLPIGERGKLVAKKSHVMRLTNIRVSSGNQKAFE